MLCLHNESMRRQEGVSPRGAGEGFLLSSRQVDEAVQITVILNQGTPGMYRLGVFSVDDDIVEVAMGQGSPPAQ